MKKNFQEFKDFIKNKKVAVLGIGVSNTPVINYLNELGAKVTAFDKKTSDAIGIDFVKELENKGVELELGENYLDKLVGYDVIFKTPGMRMDSPQLVKASKEGAYITSEMEEFIRYCKGKVYAITGSDGKTTTTSIVAELLKSSGYNVWVGGNIGTPLFAEIENISDEDKVVLELSSFQLMTINLPVDVAVVTNVTPNHLDMHKDMDEYINSKKNIFLNQSTNGVVVLNKDNDISNSFSLEANGKVRKFSSKDLVMSESMSIYKDGWIICENDKVCKGEDIILKGIHNIENYMAAFLATKDDVSLDVMKEVAESFSGVEHRCEFVREVEGVKYYNDSIASTPTRTLAGLKGFGRKVILIAGGYDKHVPFEPLAELGSEFIKSLVLMGATKKKIADVFKLSNKGKDIDVLEAESLEDAVLKAKHIASEGDIITLSPACASFDMFDNFMVRGDKFKSIVNML